MPLLVAAACLAGLGLIALGLYFRSWLAPYRALLREAASSGPTHYRGERAGTQWKVGVTSLAGYHAVDVADSELGDFLLRQALAEVDEAKARRIQMAVGPALGLDISQPWEFVDRHPRRPTRMRRVPARTFSLHRAELLRLARGLLPMDLAVEDRAARSRK